MTNTDSNILIICLTLGVGCAGVLIKKYVDDLFVVIILFLTLVVLLWAVIFFAIVPTEYNKYYIDNIHDVIVSSITPDMKHYDKLVRIETICRIYDTIPTQKCIDFAIADIQLQPLR